MPWLRKALGIFEGAGARLLTAAVWEEMAVCELGLGNDQTSLDLLRKAEVVQLDAGTPANYQVVLANIGNVYLYRDDFVTAISYYQHALTIAREIKDPVSIRKWTYNTTLAYMRMRARPWTNRSRKTCRLRKSAPVGDTDREAHLSAGYAS
jgi:tetratricopeptide (TPR) repeat protein